VLSSLEGTTQDCQLYPFADYLSVYCQSNDWLGIFEMRDFQNMATDQVSYLQSVKPGEQIMSAKSDNLQSITYMGKQGSILQTQLLSNGLFLQQAFKPQYGKFVHGVFWDHLVMVIADVDSQRIGEVYLNFVVKGRKQSYFVFDFEPRLNDFAVQMTHADYANRYFKYRVVVSKRRDADLRARLEIVDFTIDQMKIRYDIKGPNYYYLISEKSCADRLEATGHLLVVGCSETGFLEVFKLNDVSEPIFQVSRGALNGDFALCGLEGGVHNYLFVPYTDHVMMFEVIVNRELPPEEQFVS
jgi:hypothetical protein